MVVKNHNIIDKYIKYNELYKDQYDTDKYVILLQVGSFYELYNINPEDAKLKNICELLNIVATRKNKSILKISKSNPQMAGFPCVSLQKYLDVLINNNYTVMVYVQYLDKTKIKRKLDKIYSIGTYINTEKNLDSDNIILAIYREDIGFKISDRHNINQINNIICGLSTIDLSTGNVNILEIYNENYDITKLIEDINKEIIINNPKEILYIYNNNTDNIENDPIYKLLNKKNLIFHYTKTFNKEYAKINYQNEFLKKIYKNHTLGVLTPIEYLDLEKYKYGMLSYILLLQFAYNYDNSIIENINKPNVIINKEILNLHNNALEQLNIFSITNNYKYNSLFDVLNKNSTPLGKRLLKKNLAEPITNVDELNTRYNLVDKLIKTNKYKKYEKELDNIIDIEKYHKSMGIYKLQPYQLSRLYTPYQSIIKLIELSKPDFKNYFDYSILEQFQNYYDEYTKIFNINNLELYNFNNTNNNVLLNIFNENIIDEIDTIINTIKSQKNSLYQILNKLSKIINNDKIELKHTDRDGYFLSLTKIRANKLKKEIEGNVEFKDLIFENKTQSGTYITSKFIKDTSKLIIINQNKLLEITKINYFKICDKLYNKFYNIITYLNIFISNIDIIKSHAKCSILYKYSKPSINSKLDKSFISTKNIRHPIIERLLDNQEYITNDIDINLNKTGTLLYGINGCGKSSIMKSVGINLIMAQIGCYTSSTKFEFYPYNNIFTRIDHSDNIFKGMSSFEKEILELKTILNYSNSNSLVLGDEILNSTEQISAISIIGATINNFLNKNISFIFASHLHQIPDHINPNLKDKLFIGHLQTDYDNVKKCFIYNRKLQDGISCKNYGLIVAKSILNNSDIIASALNIQNTLLNNNNEIVTVKKSKYNSELYLNECYICTDLNLKHDDKQILHTHHIVFQKDFADNKCVINNKEHINKNNKYNLVNLCNYHHIETHKNNIIINKWIQTTEGLKLDYVFST